MDREKVIKGLKLHGDPKAECDECPYRNEESPGYGCLEELCNDVIALLKEQEAKNVVNMTLSKDCFLIASCPKCNALLTRVEHKNYCGECGQAVKWE